jgi:hypothetical protein
MKIRIRVKHIVLLLLALMIAVGATACGNGDVDEVKAQSYSVDFTGVGPSDSGTTFGEFIESKCPGGEWQQFTSTLGEPIVEYNDGNSPEGSVDIQWMKESSGWIVWAMEIDGTEISLAHINTFFSSPSRPGIDYNDTDAPAE